MNIFDILTKKKPKNSTPPKIIEKDGVEYRFVKNPNSKSIKITISDPFKVKISLPKNCPYKLAKEFVDKKQDWIEENLKKYNSNKIDENFKTKTDNFLITTGLLKSPKIVKSGDSITFIYPIGEDFHSKEIQQKAKEALKKALYIEAKNYLPKRLSELAQIHNFKYKNLSLKTGKTRWGSCSYVNNINLNINLMLQTNEIIDYVLIHELCHTVEKNHRESFWRLVEKCMPEYKTIKKELKSKKLIV